MRASAIGPLALLALGLSTSAQSAGFEVEPYVQPGNASSLKTERKVVLWQTAVPSATYAVEFGLVGGRSRGVRAVSMRLPTDSTLYEATLEPLAFDSKYFYRVREGGQVVFESEFATRTRRDVLQFAVVGDIGIGSIGQALIASALYRADPSFVVVTGDFVYSSGRVSEYAKRLFPILNAPSIQPGVGAPLLRSIPFYVGLGNHDMAAPNLETHPDGLAAFLYLRPPLNGPTLDSAPKVYGSDAAVSRFLEAAGDRWPSMANYSFDVGNVHIAVLDANGYANPVEPKLIEWLERDFKATPARWKFVAFHQPGFHSSKVHYAYQKMRLLAPTFERIGADVVFSGHVHNYQRTVPLRFKPEGGVREDGSVRGAFTLDTDFDGTNRTKPKGVVYIVTGAGGAPFYDPGFTDQPERWAREPESWAPFTARFIANTHSFTRVRVAGGQLQIEQVDPYGSVLDSVRMSK